MIVALPGLFSYLFLNSEILRTELLTAINQLRNGASLVPDLLLIFFFFFFFFFQKRIRNFSYLFA